MIDVVSWQAKAFGGSDRERAFFLEVFQSIDKTGKFFVSDGKGWPYRSRARWLAKLAEGDRDNEGLDVLEAKRLGKRGKWYYQLKPAYYATISEVWRWAKKQV